MEHRIKRIKHWYDLSHCWRVKVMEDLTAVVDTNTMCPSNKKKNISTGTCPMNRQIKHNKLTKCSKYNTRKKLAFFTSSPNKIL